VGCSYDTIIIYTRLNTGEIILRVDTTVLAELKLIVSDMILSWGLRRTTDWYVCSAISQLYNLNYWDVWILL